MKLYFKTGACSLATRIALEEIGIAYTAEAVDTAAGRTASGAPFAPINPNGYVPVLVLDDGANLTENPAILQYLADAYPNAGLAPAAGSLARVRLQEQLNFIASELHKSFSPFFSGQELTATERADAIRRLARRLDHVERLLADGRAFLAGSVFSVADAYLFVVLNWTNFIGVDLTPWPKAGDYLQRLATRPAIQAALQAEGLVAREAA